MTRPVNLNLWSQLKVDCNDALCLRVETTVDVNTWNTLYWAVWRTICFRVRKPLTDCVTSAHNHQMMRPTI